MVSGSRPAPKGSEPYSSSRIADSSAVSSESSLQPVLAVQGDLQGDLEPAPVGVLEHGVDDLDDPGLYFVHSVLSSGWVSGEATTTPSGW